MTASEDAPRFDPTEDERLVARCLDGDGRAWEALVLRYERLVYAVGRSYHLSDEDLGDVFQEVFSALVRGLPRLREPRTLCRWLSSTTDRIARTVALAVRRERARTDEVAADHPDPDAEPPGADLEVLEEQALVRLALERLGGRCRELLTVLYYEDPPPTYAAVGARLGMPVGSLGPTRARCMERLRDLVASLTATDSRITPATTATYGRRRKDTAPGTRRKQSRVRGSVRPPTLREVE